MKFAKTIRFDKSDLNIFPLASEEGELAVVAESIGKEGILLQRRGLLSFKAGDTIPVLSLKQPTLKLQLKAVTTCILEEIDPIKHIIIEKLSSLIKNAIPGGEVEVYGSHATKLCLHWSDIDLVLKP